MSAPVITSPVDNPIPINPGIDYKYVIPTDGAETSLGFTANPNYTLAISGRTLTLNFSAAAPASPTVFPVEVWASNGDGVTKQTINFEVSVPQLHTGAVAQSITMLTSRYGTSNLDGAALPSGFLRVGDLLVLGPAPWFGDSLANKVVYVKSISGTDFTVSATPGGAAIEWHIFGPVGVSVDTPRQIWPAFAASTSDTFWVGPTAALTVNDKISFAYNRLTGGPAFAVPAQLAVALFVKTIVDAYHVQLALTSGGAAITASGDSVANGLWPDQAGALELVISQLSKQQYPSITSAGETDVATSGSVSYSVTADISPDTVQALTLPSFLSLSGSTISGTAPGSNSTYLVILLVVKGNFQTRRYWYLKVGTGGSLVGGSSSGSVPVITTSGTTAIAQTVGVPFTFQPAATNSPKSWVIQGGVLPAGVAFDSATGAISGAFQAAGSFSLVAIAHNDAGDSTPVTFTFSVAAAAVAGTGGGAGSISLLPTIDPFAIARRRGSDLVLIADVASKTLVASASSQAPAQLAPFFQGDKIKVDFYMVTPTDDIFRPFEFKAYAAAPVIRLGIGKNLNATGGTFIVTDGVQSTAAVAYGITAAALQSAIRAALTTNWSAAAVSGPDGGPWLIDRGANGSASALTVDAANVTPDSVANVQRIRTGTGSRHEIQQIAIEQLAAAYQDAWDPILSDGSVSVSELQKGDGKSSAIQVINFSQAPLGGTFPLIFDSGKTSDIEVGATQDELQAAIDSAIGAGKIVATVVPGVSITLAYTDTAAHQPVVIDSTNIAWNIGFSAEIDLGTLGVDQLLNGAAQITATLEIEIAPDGTDQIETIIHQDVTIVKDLVDRSIYGATPNPLIKAFTVAAANFTFQSLDRIAADTSAGAFTGTLSPSPAIGDTVEIIDPKGTWSTFNFTIDGNGKLINGDSTLVCDLDRSRVVLVYIDNSTGWAAAQ